MTKWYLADTHFSHGNILKYEGRPWKTVEEMDEGLIERWNEKVKPGDLVYILGDFTLRCRRAQIEPILKRLNGQKVLLRGNHEVGYASGKSFKKNQEWLKDYFTEICDYKETYDEGRKVVLMHYPIMSWNGQDAVRGQTKAYHLYGHVHSNPKLQHPHPDAFNVGVDVNNYYPVTLTELLERRDNENH